MAGIDSIQYAELSDHLAAIKVECESIAQHEQASTAHAIRCGVHLLAVKPMLSHGSWVEWVNDNVPLALTTVQAYMRLASLDEDARNGVAHLPLRKALSEIARPRGGKIGSQIRSVDEPAIALVAVSTAVRTSALPPEERRKRANADAQHVIRLLNCIERSDLSYPDAFAEDLKRHVRRFTAPTRKPKAAASVIARLAIANAAKPVTD